MKKVIRSCVLMLSETKSNSLPRNKTFLAKKIGFAIILHNKFSKIWPMFPFYLFKQYFIYFSRRHKSLEPWRLNLGRKNIFYLFSWISDELLHYQNMNWIFLIQYLICDRAKLKWPSERRFAQILPGFNMPLAIRSIPHT